MTASPNILLITTHDSGRHFGCYGVPAVHTPAIDGLAAEGVRFTNMFAASSICSPSRGALLTGRHPQRNGLLGLAGGCWNWRLRDPRHHLSHILRERGYRTALFGIQHESSLPDLPRLGFDQRNPYLEGDAQGDEADALAYARAFASFARKEGRDDRPFYAQVGFFETHTPFERGRGQPDDCKGIFVPPYTGIAEPDAKLRAYLAGLQGSVRKVDQAVGIILEGLREAGLEENTLVLFNTDHGVELPRSKWTLYDAGLGIAFILRWPGAPGSNAPGSRTPGSGIRGGRTCDWLLSNVDFVPTLCELAGLQPPAGLDGVSFAAACTGEAENIKDPAASPRDTAFSLFVNGQLYSARSARYKLIRNFSEGFGPDRQPQPVVEFYDLAEDPYETRNLAGDQRYADAYADLSARLWRWLEEVNDPILRGPVPTPTWQRAIAEYYAEKR